MVSSVLQLTNTKILIAIILLLGLFLFPTDFTYALDIGRYINTWIYWLAIRLGGLVLLVGATLLDAAIWNLVIKMGTYFVTESGTPGGVGAAVNAGWTIIRDVMNMFFIFGLIYIGIKTILNSNDTGTRRMLAYLIGAALLINFSLYITQTIVDFSNLVSVQIYSQLTEGETPEGSPNSKATSPIAAKFLSVVGLTSILSTNDAATNDFADNYKGNLFVLSIVIFLFFVLSGIAFLLGAIMIVTRFVALILFMVFSPLMFLGWILPRFQSVSTNWWDRFFKYTFLGPIYVFLLYLSLLVLVGIIGADGAVEKTAFGKGLSGDLQNSSITVILNFSIMIALLWASLQVGNKMGIAGGKMAVGGFNAIGRGALGMTTGAAIGAGALGYRWTGGRIGSGLVKGYDAINSRTDGALTKIGGENVRRSFGKMKNYKLAGGNSIEDVEKDYKEGKARIRKQQYEATWEQRLAAGNVTDREVAEYLKDPSKRQAVLDNAGNLNSSVLKHVSGDKDIDDSTATKLKKSHKAAVSNKFGSAKEIKEVAKQFKNDAKDIHDAAGEHIVSDAMAEYLVENPNMIEEMGKHLSFDDAAELKTKIHKAAKKKADGGTSLKGVMKKFQNSRTWT